MKKWFFIVFLTCIGGNYFAQDKMSTVLFRASESAPYQWQEVVVVGVEKVDAEQFVSRQKANNVSRDKITTLLLSELKKQTKFQEGWLNELTALGLPYTIKHRFWSINVVVISAPAKTLRHLEKHPDVYWMEKTTERAMEFHTPVSMEPISNRAVNGSEQGIYAVKANELWQLGYSGKGSKLLTFDTGIWPHHPSFRDQFLGSHVPMNEAWFGYDTYFPGDKSDSHGTHVTGTCMGLDPATSDTIGLAYNAYFLGTDPIVQSVADIKNMDVIFRGYEWALNPDGDINTTDDMPDVINNSWGRAFGTGDSVICDGWVSDMFVTLEAANIISIQSAGNSGPNLGTVGAPALANVSVVNNFSVGAVNGHNASFPIASFSSRGPTVCGDTGALLIKPEVVAPGVNVRSSVRDITGAYSFSNFQGTSMASPHVSGVALLLREAFPYATAKEIKESMYYTANDLGATGEDNIYGNGMIDAMAAYSYLSNLYTPTTPASNGLDIHLVDFDVTDYSSHCGMSTITAYFNNSNDVPAGNMIFEYGVYGQAPQTKTISGNVFNAIDSVTFTVGGILQPGWNEFYVHAMYVGSNQDVDEINNTRFVRFWVADEINLPYQENFDSVHVFESSLYVENPDERFTWDTALVQGKQGISTAAVMKFTGYSPRQYQHDIMQTPVLNIEPTSHLMLQFDVSYQYKFSGFADSLSVQVSTNCGTSWDAAVYSKNPDSLNTTTKPYTAGSWIPTDSADWRTETVDLSAYTNANSIMIRFISANGQGNYLYVDNINVFDDRGIASVEDVAVSDLVIYPNPTNTGTLHFSKRISGKLYSISGMELKRFENVGIIDVSGLPNGVYMILNATENTMHKVIIQK